MRGSADGPGRGVPDAAAAALRPEAAARDRLHPFLGDQSLGADRTQDGHPFRDAVLDRLEHLAENALGAWGGVRVAARERPFLDAGAEHLRDGGQKWDDHAEFPQLLPLVLQLLLGEARCRQAEDRFAAL